jgi:hypothetical protein
VGGVILVRLDELRAPVPPLRGAVTTTANKEARAQATSPLEHANDVEPVP